jgi:polar amino acid transport system substrate-binding protein
VINADNALEQNFKKIMAGRVVTTLESVYVAEAKLKEMNLVGQIEQAGLMGEPTPMYIACSPAKPSSKEYAKLLSEGVKKMRASGKLKAILDKYGVKDWK